MEQWETFIKESKKKFDAMLEADTKAKEAGTLIGRYINEPVADGYAYYVVAKVKGAKCTLKHVDIYDAYKILFVEYLGRVVPKRYVTTNIEQRDALKELFSKKG